MNEAVRQNQDRFPTRFTFKLTYEESKVFLVEIFDQKKRLEDVNLKIIVAMLATILKSKISTSKIDIITVYHCGSSINYAGSKTFQ